MNESNRDIILKHYKDPINKGLIDDNSYETANTNNESCIDEVNLMVKIDDDEIKDIHFDGDACAICTSSTSIMIETLQGKTVEEAQKIVNSFENMIEGNDYDESILENAKVYQDISRQPSRKKCALLGWWGMKKILNKK